MGSKKVSIEFTRNELIHLRRFLNRAINCCEGDCPRYTMPAWYYLEGMMKRIQAAFVETGTPMIKSGDDR